MTPLYYSLFGFILGIATMLIIIGIIANCGGMTEPDIERRTGKGCRRTRFKAAHKVDDIADAYGAEALTYPQAIARLREMELPGGIERRVLKGGA